MNERQAYQQVKLLTYTSNPLHIIYTAARTCYSPDNAIEMYNRAVDEEDVLKLVKKVLGMGHESIAEHFYMTFAVAGVSRVLSHQHVRHRHKTFSQKSQRYVTYHAPFKYIIPPSIENSRYKEAFEKVMEKLQVVYNNMVSDGIPGEDARYVFPNACETSYIVSCNFRELMYFSNLRLCSKAQWEIRNLVNKMCALVVEAEPWTEKYLVPKCHKYKRCTEDKSCGQIEKKFVAKFEEV